MFIPVLVDPGFPALRPVDNSNDLERSSVDDLTFRDLVEIASGVEAILSYQ